MDLFPGRLLPPPSDSSSSPSPVSDPEDFSRTRSKKKSLKNTSVRSRHHHQNVPPPSSKPKGIFAPIPTVPQGFVPYQLTSDSNLFTGSRSSKAALTMEEGSGKSNISEIEKNSIAVTHPSVLFSLLQLVCLKLFHFSVD